MISYFLAAIITYRGTVALPHDASTGYVGILDSNSHLHRSTLEFSATAMRLSPGDIVEATEDEQYDGIRFRRSITSLRVIGHGPAPVYEQISASELSGNETFGRFVSVTGTVHDIYRDDADQRFIFAVINSGRESILWATACGSDIDSDIPDLIGSEVRVQGLADRADYTARRCSGNLIWSISMSNLSILSPPSHGLFEAPNLANVAHLKPSDIVTLPRHRAVGRVLAVWNRRSFLLQRIDRAFSTVELAQDRPPDCGDEIEVVGFPESDLYTLNLTRAFWRPSDNPNPLHARSQAPIDCIIDDFHYGQNGNLVPRAKLHGKLVRTSGIVRRRPRDGMNGCALIEANGRVLEINPGQSRHAFDKIDLGFHISVTGIIVIEKECWKPNRYLPNLKNAMLVLRDGDDIKVLAEMPFWTPAKFLSIIALLIVLILFILLRNRAIQRLSDERIKERTRLAAELHDTIAQNLTGAAIQLETAETMAAKGPEKLRKILALTIKIMHVSREELRDCIWDLRNQTFDEKRLADAFRRTLTPHLCETQLRIRFPVNRSDITDRTVHAALSITRELVANAIHHGHANSIAIAGTVENDLLLFSVCDNGCGFFTEHVAGSHEGHFGLTGIRERVRKLGGTFKIHSIPGHGTKATVSLPK